MRLNTGLDQIFLPIQHHHYDRPESGEPFDLALRNTTITVRVRDRTLPEENNPLYWIYNEREDIADLVGGLIWLSKDRSLNSSGFIYSASTSNKWKKQFQISNPNYLNKISFEDEGLNSPSTIDVLPLGSGNFNTKDSLAAYILPLPVHGRTGLDMWPEFPKNEYFGIVLNTHDESEQAAIFMPTDPRLVAPHRGGNRFMGSIVSDVDNEEEKLDSEIFGRIHTQWRVTHDGERYSVGRQMSSSIDGSGHGLSWGQGDSSEPNAQSAVPPGVSGNEVVYYESYTRGGFSHPGHINDKHRIGVNEEFEAINPGHIWIDSLFYKNKDEDGPLNHTRWMPGIDREILTKVYFGYSHGIQRWDWWTTTTILPALPPEDDTPPPPDEPPTDDPPVDDPPTSGPPIIRDPITGQPISDDFADPWGDPTPLPKPPKVPPRPTNRPNPQRGDRITPGRNGQGPIDPARFNQQLEVHSLIVRGARDPNTQPNDGAWGPEVPLDPPWGGDSIIDPSVFDPKRWNLPVPPVVPEDPDAAIFDPKRWNLPMPPGLPEGDFGDGGNYIPISIPESVFDPQNWNKPAPSVQYSQEFNPRDWNLPVPQEPIIEDDNLVYINTGIDIYRDRGYLNKVNYRTRLSPYDDPFNPYPGIVHFTGYAAHDGGGKFLYKSNPATIDKSAVWVTGTPEQAVFQIAPHGLLLDGVEDQSDVIGNLDVLFYSGDRGGDSSRFGFGTPHPQKGIGVNSALFTYPENTTHLPGDNFISVIFLDDDGNPIDGLFSVEGNCFIKETLYIGDIPANPLIDSIKIDADGPNNKLFIEFYNNSGVLTDGEVIVSGDIIPNTNGNNLGNPTERWDVYSRRNFLSYRTFSSNDTLTDDVEVAVVTSDITLTLPDAEVTQDGRLITVRVTDIGADTVTLTVNSGTIEGNSSLSLSSDECVKLMALGSTGNWLKIC